MSQRRKDYNIAHFTFNKVFARNQTPLQKISTVYFKLIYYTKCILKYTNISIPVVNLQVCYFSTTLILEWLGRNFFVHP